jgi:hypothetical protein
VLLGRESSIEGKRLLDGMGFGSLDKVWKSFDGVVSSLVLHPVLLLYDADTKKCATDRGLIKKRVIPFILDNPIESGIENLFAATTIEKVEANHPEFIDLVEVSETRVRGRSSAASVLRTVNRDEKGNLCGWLCENGTKEDFESFHRVFDLIDNALPN